MEGAVDDQVRRMSFQRDARFRRFAGAGFARQHDIAEQYLSPFHSSGVAVGEAREQVGLHLRKGEDVGGLVTPPNIAEIGRASCRERVCQYVYISVVAVSLNKKMTENATN